MLWSMLANLGAYVLVSLLDSPSAEEHRQASLFVDVFKRSGDAAGARFWRGTASAGDLHHLLTRFLGAEAADDAFRGYARRKGVRWPEQPLSADAEFVHHVETQLAGAIGAASARIMVASAVKEEALSLEEVRKFLDEASQVVMYSHRLEQKSRELEAATNELRGANQRLQELDRLKDDFISTVTHELRTPLTSIRAFSEILNDNPRLDATQRAKFLGIIIKESERLTRLINQVLDLAKIESGAADWHSSEIDMREVLEDSAGAVSQLFKERDIRLTVELPQKVPGIVADRDRLMQVMLNLLSNAAKFSGRAPGAVTVSLAQQGGFLCVEVADNGVGISAADQEVIFEKFRQAGDMLTGKPQGSGLGLHISRRIVEHFGGRMWVTSRPGEGACFSFTLPLAREPALVNAA
jgi:signal transduction histidine kinase